MFVQVNLVTDGPPATALGFNPTDPAVMKLKPRSRHQPLMNSWLLTRYIITGLFVGFSTVGAFIWWYELYIFTIAHIMNFLE